MRHNELNRRNFLGTMAGLGGAWMMNACTSNGSTMAPTTDVQESLIGVQLYTVRDRMRTDFEGTLEQVAAIGYKEVEPHDYFGRSPQQVRDILDRLGLTAPAAHIQLARFREDLPGLFAASSAIGHQYLVVPVLDGSLRNRDGYRAVASELNSYGQAARQAGLRVGYHNHDFEFAALPGGGTGMEILLAETNPDFVEFELDIYWAVKGGQDPLAMFQRNPGRFPLWHVKDMSDRAGAQRMADVGTGEIDFRAIFARADQSGLKHFFVERDDPQDSIASIQTSYTNLRAIL